MQAFYGAPTFNTIDYFVIILLISIFAVPLSYTSPKPLFQNILHICVGSLCLFAVAPRLFVFYVLIWTVVYLLTVVCRMRAEGYLGYAKVFLPILILLSPMLYWKLAPVTFERLLNLDLHGFIWDVWQPAGEIDATYFLVAPLGLSFSIFRAIDLIIQVNIGLVEKPSFVRVLAYGLFAPIQIVGPIAQFREVDQGVGDTPERFRLARWGALQILIGLAKAFVLAWPLAWSQNIVTVFPNEPSWVVWLSILIFPVYMYLNFSGFSDISIGTAAVFGYRLAPNFNNPLLRSSLQQFWNNWHMSLTRFAQRNIFVPLGGYRSRHQYFALFCTMMTIAFWHDLSIALAIFGAAHGIGLIIGRVVETRKKPSDAPIAVARTDKDWKRVATNWAMTYLFITLTFPLLLLHDGSIARFYASLLGLRY